MNMIKRGVGGAIMLSWTSDAVVDVSTMIMNEGDCSGAEVLRFAVWILSNVAWFVCY